MAVIEENARQEFSFDGLFGSKLKGWAHDPQGISAGGWGLCMTARDMAAFGQVYLNGGTVNGKMIISEGWIQKTFTPNEAHYGYLWWQPDKGGGAVAFYAESGRQVGACEGLHYPGGGIKGTERSEILD